MDLDNVLGQLLALKTVWNKKENTNISSKQTIRLFKDINMFFLCDPYWLTALTSGWHMRMNIVTWLRILHHESKKLGPKKCKERTCAGSWSVLGTVWLVTTTALCVPHADLATLYFLHPILNKKVVTCLWFRRLFLEIKKALKL